MNKDKRHKLKSLEIAGFKSIGSLQRIDFGDINVLIGANGAGKSNLVSCLKMLNRISNGSLQLYIGRQGYADSLLYYGSETTGKLNAKLLFENTDSYYVYDFALTKAIQGQMMFAWERMAAAPLGTDTPLSHLGEGYLESFLRNGATTPQTDAILKLISGIQVYQFHDTSDNSPIRQPVLIDDNRYLKPDGSNLAAFLYTIKNQAEMQKYYERIVGRIQIIMPQFTDFYLEPAVENPRMIKLEWQAKGHEYIFGAHQISDGSLRFIALATLLLQAPEYAPGVIVIDEPELGLHPEALIDLVGMIKIASQHSQIILSTQSSFLMNLFEPDEIIIVENKQDHSVFRRLNEAELSEWLQEYSLSELWEKNLLGGRP